MKKTTDPDASKDDAREPAERPARPALTLGRKERDAISPRLIREIAKVLSDTDLTEIEVKQGDLRIRVARHVHPVPAYAQPLGYPPPLAAPMAVSAPPVRAAAVIEDEDDADNPNAVRSPMVGTIYLRANPNAKPFVEIGAAVKEGDKVLLVEAMKTFNDILAPRAGIISRLLVEDGQPVEYDQPLFILE